MDEELKTKLIDLYMNYIHGGDNMETFAYKESCKGDLSEKEIINLLNVGRTLYRKI